MVRRATSGQHGASSLGCLFSMMLFMGALYFGLPMGHAYWEYTQLLDEMRTVVQFAQTSDDEQMRQQILLRVQRLDLPPSASRIRITRVPTNRRVMIQTAWSRVVELPFTQRELHFNPRVEGVY